MSVSFKLAIPDSTICPHECGDDGKCYDYITTEEWPKGQQQPLAITTSGDFSHCYSEANLHTWSDASDRDLSFQDPITQSVITKPQQWRKSPVVAETRPSAPPLPKTIPAGSVSDPTSPTPMQASAPKPALILFHADEWCGPCKRFMPVWREFKKWAASEPYVLIKSLECDCSKSGSKIEEQKHY